MQINPNNLLLKYLYILLISLIISACSRCPFDESPGVITPSPSSDSLRTELGSADGWSESKLSLSLEYANEIGSSAIVILHEGKVVAEWGNTIKKLNSHSVRKSLLNSLYGIAIERGLIDISKTLEQVSIDDKAPSLSNEEKQATIEDLLKSRSGVYHQAAYESNNAKRTRPARGSHPPGSFWYYNNWDFNALASIFENATQLSVGQAFLLWIANPIGMLDFSENDVDYVYEQSSIHPAYPFWITTRDLARFGVLYLNEGVWQETQIVPKSWIEASLQKYSDASSNPDDLTYYGYLWWVKEDGSYWAQGTGQQVLYINPSLKLVISHRTDTCQIDEDFRPVSQEIDNLIASVINAHPVNQ